MGGELNTVGLAHRFLSEAVCKGDICIDATAGRGRDTAFLCELVGENGRVLAFDIQEDAIESTRELLNNKGFANCAELILDSHANMELYAKAGTVQGICFNFGWLPGGSHSVFTRAESSIAAIEAGLRLLRVGGRMSLSIYYGRDCGFEERDALLEYLPTLDNMRYTVLICDFANRPNNPAIPIMIIRDA